MTIYSTKTDTVRKVPVPDYLMARIPVSMNSFTPIVTTLSGKPLDQYSRNNTWKAFKRALDISMGAKVYRNKIITHAIAPDFVPYCLRHTFCTDLQKAGVDIRVAQYLMGHKSIKMTADIYTHIDDETIREAARKIEMKNRGVEHGGIMGGIKTL